MTRKVRVDTRLKNFDKSALIGAANNLLSKRRQLVHCPWSEAPYDFYINAFPREVRDAMAAITHGYGEKFKKIITRSDDGVLSVKMNAIDVYVTFEFGVWQPAQGGWNNESRAIFLKPAHPMHDELVKFASACMHMDDEIDDAKRLVEHTVEMCNTYGQIHRLWPELLPTIGGAKVQAAENQKRTSSLPANIMADKIMKHRDEYTFWMAQGALLPDKEGVSWVAFE